MHVTLHKVSKRYSGIWALHDVDLDVRQGEILGLLGPGASGKTTLLHVIAGSEKPNIGTITFEGKKPAVEYLDGNAPKGGLRLFGGRHDRDSYRHAHGVISGTKADVLLLDETIACFDRAERATIFQLVRDLVASGERSVVFASSEFAHLAEVCDRLAVLVDGEIVQTGFVQEIYENPVSAAVAEAGGAVNLFAARRLTSTDASLPEFFTIDGGHRLFAQETERSALGAINQTIRLGIRPEHVSISTDASFPEDNLIKAVVTDIRFLGPLTTVGLDASGLKLSATVSRIVGLNRGEECMIAMPPHRIQVFKS